VRSEPPAGDLDGERRPGGRRLAHELFACSNDRVAPVERRSRRERAQAATGRVEAGAAPFEQLPDLDHDAFGGLRGFLEVAAGWKGPVKGQVTLAIDVVTWGSPVPA